MTTWPWWRNRRVRSTFLPCRRLSTTLALVSTQRQQQLPKALTGTLQLEDAKSTSKSKIQNTRRQLSIQERAMSPQCLEIGLSYDDYVAVVEKQKGTFYLPSLQKIIDVKNSLQAVGISNYALIQSILKFPKIISFSFCHLHKNVQFFKDEVGLQDEDLDNLWINASGVLVRSSDLIIPKVCPRSPSKEDCLSRC
eukprot:TRINITY_DN4257_c0_g1_i1.p1 TRINITY_DN4257_c0_g1~~TRINITY_DN4257_c0_g1_i1.p1  ORF type:complete len:195 (+),score=37.85 TRINITY_DN4257_c0_g1_i1:263-847(+)